MKTICLIRERPHTRFFVNQIHQCQDVSLVVIERPNRVGSLRRVVGRRGWRGLVSVASERVGRDRRYSEAYDAVFGDQWKKIDDRIPRLIVENINDSAVSAHLAELKPDLLLDHGTSIVSAAILSTAKLTLNLHWGLSPYYRGTACTEWGLINWDARNIGVTIHELSDRIDGGRIAAQRRVELRPDDSVRTINARLTLHGTKLILELIKLLRRGSELRFVEQDPDIGFLYLKKHFSRELQAHVRNLEARGMIAEMVERPARGHLVPIVNQTV